jgi:BirA family biotin operon repressor/biotin-[acetyl-CoA-carboxylase] ligase
MTAAVGWTLYRFATVDSTQHVAAALVARGAPHRTAVMADQQTAGYGRKGDRWLDAPGHSLLVTLILRPELIGEGKDKGGSRLSSLPPRSRDGQAGKSATTSLVLFPMAAALAALDAIAATTGARGAIKWPNDLLLGGRKVGGILGDATWSGGRLDALRIGIGVNIRGARETFPARGLPDATSIAAEAGRDLDRDTLLDALLRSFTPYDDALAAGEAATVISRWRAAIATVGTRVTATLQDGRTVCGIAVEVADDGDLLIADDAGTVTRLSAPAVRSLRPSMDEQRTDRSP